MTHHHLKIWPEYFLPKLAGVKPWEWRKEDDKKFAPGDFVTFTEVEPPPAEPTPTGRTLGPFAILYVFRPLERPGYCIFTHS